MPKFKCDILSNFQTMCNGKHYIKLVWFQNLFFLSQQRIDKRKSKYVLLFNKNCIISQGPVFRKMQLFHLQWRTLVTFLQAFALLSCWTVALPISQKVNQSTSWKLHLALSTSPYLVAHNCAQMIFDHEWNEREPFFVRKSVTSKMTSIEK